MNAALCPQREQALAEFYERWQSEALVVDKWLVAQSTSRRPDTLATVKALTEHPAFDAGNPNKIYALIRSFGANLVRFNAADGSGYAFIADRILMLHDKNPQVASRLARCFDRWKKFDTGRQAQAQAAGRGLWSQPSPMQPRQFRREHGACTAPVAAARPGTAPQRPQSQWDALPQWLKAWLHFY